MDNITKEKNIFTFVNSKGHTYTFDLNIGEIRGTRGQIIHNFPDEFISAAKHAQLPLNYALYVYAISASIDKKALLYRFQAIERLINAGAYATREDVLVLMQESNTMLLVAPCGEIVKIMRQYNTDGLLEALRYWNDDLFCQKFHLKKDGKMTEATLHALQRHCQNLPLNRHNDFVSVVDYYIHRGLLDVYHYSEAFLEEVLQFCQYFWTNNLPPIKGNYALELMKIKEIDVARKERNINSQLQNCYNNNYERLFFEDQNFIVCLPTCTRDFHNEAVQQANCIERLYMQKVAEGQTNIVFIRKKSKPTKSFITCEITTQGIICQMLTRNNRPVSNPHALNFVKSYQEFLASRF